MRSRKAAYSEHGARHVTPAGRSVFYDLLPAERAAEMEMRARLLMGFEQWLDKSTMRQGEAAKVLGVTQACVGFEERKDQPIQHGSVGTLGSARRAQAQAEVGGMRVAAFRANPFLGFSAESAQRRPTAPISEWRACLDA
jgi:predicted XRE-type DNA-binding protein